MYTGPLAKSVPRQNEEGQVFRPPNDRAGAPRERYMSKVNLKTNELGQLQIELLKLLWKRGRATVQELLDEWPHKNPPAYVTILTVLRRLEKRGFLAHDMQGRAFVYRPLVAEHEVKGDLLDDLVKRLFGTPSNMVSGLLSHQRVTLSELGHIRQLVEQKEFELRQAQTN